MSKPTIVLVHGAFADSSSWTGVIAKLQEQGYPVVAVANPLRGVESDAAYVASVVNGVSGPVVTQRPVAQEGLAAPFEGTPAWSKLPSWTLIADQDNAIPAAAQEFMAERASSTVRRVDASHAVAVSQPETVAEVIIAAATSTD